eukprot:1578606-Rhodomonas_salina.2
MHTRVPVNGSPGNATKAWLYEGQQLITTTSSLTLDAPCPNSFSKLLSSALPWLQCPLRLGLGVGADTYPANLGLLAGLTRNRHGSIVSAIATSQIRAMRTRFATRMEAVPQSANRTSIWLSFCDDTPLEYWL